MPYGNSRDSHTDDVTNKRVSAEAQAYAKKLAEERTAPKDGVITNKDVIGVSKAAFDAGRATARLQSEGAIEKAFKAGCDEMAELHTAGYTDEPDYPDEVERMWQAFKKRK